MLGKVLNNLLKHIVDLTPKSKENPLGAKMSRKIRISGSC